MFINWNECKNNKRWNNLFIDNNEMWITTHSCLDEADVFYLEKYKYKCCIIVDTYLDSKYIYFLLTNEEDRNNGFAYNTIIEFIKFFNNEDIVLECDEDMKHFYNKFGFVEWNDNCSRINMKRFTNT